MTRQMKESGVDWIGEMPSHWKTSPLHRLFFINAGGDAKSEFYSSEKYGEYMYPVYTNTKDESKVYAYTSKPIFPSNSITVSGRGDIGNAYCRYEPFDAIIRLLVLIPKSECSIEFFKYFINDVIVFNTESSAVGQLSALQIAPYIVAVPPLSEQLEIVNYLNDKIKKIDAIIQTTQQSLEELQKYKQSLITEVVTKGLDKKVEMIESNIDWVGSTPKDWGILRVKSLFEIVDERNKTDENAILLSLFTALGVKPRSEMEDKGNKAQTVINYKKVIKNDLVVNKLLAWMGAIGYSDYDGVTSPDYDVYRARANDKVDKRYYNYYFRDTDFKTDCYKYGRGIMMMRWRTYPEQFLNIRVLNPPLKIQKKIADYLDEKTKQINKLIENKIQLIKEFEQYKKSLIYEYVTGKKEV